MAMAMAITLPAPSAHKPPSLLLRRNESSSSVLAEGNNGPSAKALSRSNSFLSAMGAMNAAAAAAAMANTTQASQSSTAAITSAATTRGFNRSNSILSLLSSFPTSCLKESSSTERLFGLDVTADDRLLSSLKHVDSSTAIASSVGIPVHNVTSSMQLQQQQLPTQQLVFTSSGSMDRSLSFGQLDNIGALTDFDDPSSVAIALQDEAKWTES